jgi:hypothetical protein
MSEPRSDRVVVLQGGQDEIRRFAALLIDHGVDCEVGCPDSAGGG